MKIFNWIKKEDLFSFSFFRDFVKKKQISWSYHKHLWCCYKFLEEILKIGQKMFQSLHSFLKILTTREKKLLHLKLNQQKKIFLSTTKFCILWKILERRYLTETSNFQKLLAAKQETIFGIKLLEREGEIELSSGVRCTLYSRQMEIYICLVFTRLFKASLLGVMLLE